MVSLTPLIPLLTAAGVLLAGNGLQGTLIALRGAAEGFNPTVIGLTGTSYFIGFLISCIWSPKLLRAVGHIRVFAALAAIAAAGTLLLVLLIDPVVWIGLRFVMGFCFAGLFMTIESWLNEATRNADRARVLSIYRMIDLTAVTGSQFMLPAIGVQGFAIFAVAAMITCLSLVPVSLADRSNPNPPAQVKFDLRKIWSISPLAFLGCITIGMTNSAFRIVGPLYASDQGLDINGVALFMSAGIIGGAVLQFPFGWLSDRFDRRWVLIIGTAGASLAGLFMSQVSASPTLLYAGIFAFGAFSLPLYSLSAAHANDRAGEGQYVLVAAGLSFCFSLGASVGPLIVSAIIARYGSEYFFAYTSAVHLVFVFLTLWRMSARRQPTSAERKGFIALLRTSPVFARLAHPRRNDSPSD